MVSWPMITKLSANPEMLFDLNWMARNFLERSISLAMFLLISIQFCLLSIFRSSMPPFMAQTVWMLVASKVALACSQGDDAFGSLLC